MKTKTIFISLISFGVVCLHAQPRILIDGIHGWSTPQSNMSDVMNPAEMFPDFAFDYLDAGDIIIDQVLVSGYLQSSQDTITFMVPEDSWVLYLRYEVGDTTHFQHPYFYLLNPAGAYISSNCNGIAHVEMPVSGVWTMIYTSWDEEDIWFEVGTGPPVYTEVALEPYDMILQMVDNTYALFVGELPRLSDAELDVTRSFMENGGGYLLLRETDMSMVDKPIIHLSSNRAQTVDFSLIFPGLPTYMEPLAQVTTQGSHSRLNWTSLVVANAVSEILYEGRPRQGLNFLTVNNFGSELLVENHSAVNLESIRVLAPQPDGRFRVAYQEYLGASQHARLSYGPPLSSTDLALNLQLELEGEALQLGLSEIEADSFFKQYQWINRLLTKASRSGNPCAIYNFSGEAYQRLIPLKEQAAFSEVVRVMWVLVENVPARLTEPPLTPERVTRPEWDSPEEGNTLVYHEYGVIEEKYPPPASTRDLDLFNVHFEDAILVDETNHLDGNTWAPTFHTFGSHPLAQTLTQGVAEIQGQMSSPISMIDPSNILIVSGDEDTHAEGSEMYPPGSYPAVAVAEMIGNSWFIGVNDINILADYPGNRRFLANCIQTLSGWEPQVIRVPDDVASIQAAIDSASNGDTVLVAPGTYREHIDFSGKAICVLSETGPAETIIQGDSTQSVASFISGESESSVLKGFTISGGWAFPLASEMAGGGGIRCIQSSPSIIENLILANHAEMYIDGAGVFCSGSSPLIMNNTIRDNSGAYYGGGISVRHGSFPVIQGNLIEQNTTASGWGIDYGSGIYVGSGCGALITQNIIQDNVIDYGFGGGIALRGSEGSQVYHNLIVNNVGAGIACLDSNRAYLVNNTIHANTQGIYSESYSHPVLVNSIVWLNDIIINNDYFPSDITVAYSDVQGGWEGLNNINVDPLCVNPESLDFNLSETSPCVDAGTSLYLAGPDTLVNLPASEYHGNGPDLGALESPFVVQLAPDPALPQQIRLYQNYPNPFNPSTTLRYGISEDSHVSLVIYDLRGSVIQTLESGSKPAGWHELTWDGQGDDGRKISTGIYFARLMAGEYSHVIKMLYIK